MSNFVVTFRGPGIDGQQFVAVNGVGRHFLSPRQKDAVTFEEYNAAMREIVWIIQHRRNFPAGIMQVLEQTDELALQLPTVPAT